MSFKEQKNIVENCRKEYEHYLKKYEGSSDDLTKTARVKSKICSTSDKKLFKEMEELDKQCEKDEQVL